MRRKPRTPRPTAWIAVAISATTAGILLGIAAEETFYESFGFGGWLLWGALLAAATASPVLCASALMSGRSLPTFLELIGPREGRAQSFPTRLLGSVLAVSTVIAAQTAFGALFDSRWRDLPFAALTMAAVPFSTLALLNRPKSGPRPIAEAVFAGLFAAAAVHTVFIEGSRNWQATWTAAAYFLLGISLWRARGVAVATATSATVPSANPNASEAVLFGKQAGGVRSNWHRHEPGNHREDLGSPAG